MKVYLIGSLRNPEVPRVARELRDAGFNVFDDWYAAGPEADDKWRDYEKGRGSSFIEGLNGLSADHVFQFDRKHLLSSDASVLMLPAGKSGHLELGWMLGLGKPGYILLDNPERWDVMYKFATGVVDKVKDLIEALKPKTEPKDFDWTLDEKLHGGETTPVDSNGYCKCHGVKIV